MDDKNYKIVVYALQNNPFGVAFYKLREKGLKEIIISKTIQSYGAGYYSATIKSEKRFTEEYSNKLLLDDFINTWIKVILYQESLSLSTEIIISFEKEKTINTSLNTSFVINETFVNDIYRMSKEITQYAFEYINIISHTNKYFNKKEVK